MSRSYYKNKIKNLERENMFLEEALVELDSFTSHSCAIKNSFTKKNYLLGSFYKIKKLKEIK